MTRVQPYSGTEPYIFFSYAHRDSTEAQPIIRRLSEAGYRVWYDEGIDPGTEWDENIAVHVEGCSFFLALISKAYLASDNCRDELNYARDLSKQRVLVYLEPVELPGGMKMRLSRIQAIHKYGYEDESRFYDKLFQAQGIDMCCAKPIGSGESRQAVRPKSTPAISPASPALVSEKNTPAIPAEPLQINPHVGPDEFPSLELLNSPAARPAANAEKDAFFTRRLEECLKSNGCPAKVQYITHGSAVTRYALAVEPGMRVSGLTKLKAKIAYAMGAGHLRIDAPIPGTMLVGVEVPNREKSTVSLREVLAADTMQQPGNPLHTALGVDLAGQPVICDLERMPHLLIAGDTGAGKSVCIHSMLQSLLYRCTPADVRFILVAPNTMEMSCYEDLPHLLRPVVSKPEMAATVLHGAVHAMMHRYELFQTASVRNLDNYNKTEAAVGAKLPRIVIVIDELSSLMMTCRKEMEESICRLAQLGRAAGIHLIVATSSPNASVLTGLIRANIPSRIAFRVATAEESRMILDRAGAEELLGCGDMLYMPTGSFAPMRVQGCFVSQNEVKRVTDFLRQGSAKDMAPRPIPTEALTRALDALREPEANQRELLARCIDVAVDEERMSPSLLQRRLEIGFSRASQLLDVMEKLGVIGPSDGAKPRKCLISRTELEAMRAAGKLP